MLTYANATDYRDALDIAMREASHRLNAIVDALCAGKPRLMGLTPDSVKADPAYREAKLAYDQAFQRLRNFNAIYTRQFKREIAADRKAARG